MKQIVLIIVAALALASCAPLVGGVIGASIAVGATHTRIHRCAFRGGDGHMYWVYCPTGRRPNHF